MNSSTTSPGGGTGGGGSGGTGSSSLAGGWTGTTSQAQPFLFLVTDAGIVAMQVGYRVTAGSCTDAIVSLPAREPPNAPYAITNGAISIVLNGSTGSITIGGTVAASGASGTIVVNSTKCSTSFSGTWTATKATAAEVNLTGTWSASFASSLVPRINGTLTLSQSGSTVTGTYSIPNNAAGTVSGTVSGRMVTFALTQTTTGCTGAFAGHGTVLSSPELLTYAYTGSDCLGAHTGGNGTATRP